MRLSEAKRKYRNQYILFRYTNKGQKIGRVVCHSKNRDDVHRKIMALPKPFKNLHLTYAGPLIPKGWGTLLCLK